MPAPKRGLTTRATVAADVCHCGHRVDAHDGSENCRHRNQAGGCGCTSVRVEREQ